MIFTNLVSCIHYKANNADKYAYVIYKGQLRCFMSSNLALVTVVE